MDFASGPEEGIACCRVVALTVKAVEFLHLEAGAYVQNYFLLVAAKRTRGVYL